MQYLVIISVVFLALMKKNLINCLEKTVQPNIVIQLNLQNIGFKFNTKG